MTMHEKIITHDVGRSTMQGTAADIRAMLAAHRETRDDPVGEWMEQRLRADLEQNK